MPEATILVPDLAGRNNADLTASGKRMAKAGVYQDLSTIIIIPAFGTVPTKVAASWMNMIMPPNQPVLRFWPMHMEVGAAYSQTIEMILNHPDLSKFKYLLTIEHDNAPPPDGLLKLMQRAEAHPEFAAIGGLYWTKGESGVAQIWGNPSEVPLNFKPQAPRPGELVECCGTGMGFTLFRMSMFKEGKMPRPFFKTVAQFTPGVGSSTFTQDLYFWMEARKHGYRCAIDCGVLVGHYDLTNDMMW